METIQYEVTDGIALLTLNRPDVLNGINPKMIEEVRAAVADFSGDDQARVLVMTGAGRAFCSGADLATAPTKDDGMTTGQRVAHGMDTGFNPMVREIAEAPKPVLAAVNGTTAGGGVGLALSADIVVAARSASFI